MKFSTVRRMTKNLLGLALTLYLYNGWYYETDREVIVKDGKLVFKDDGKEVPKKEQCKS